MSENGHIDLVEFPVDSIDELAAQKAFFSAVFDWSFTAWSDEYADTEESGVACGIAVDTSTRSSTPLAVIYAEDLETTKDEIVSAGGTIVEETFSFPGGRRFHFTDPAGNELAVWSE